MGVVPWHMYFWGHSAGTLLALSGGALAILAPTCSRTPHRSICSFVCSIVCQATAALSPIVYGLLYPLLCWKGTTPVGLCSVLDLEAEQQDVCDILTTTLVAVCSIASLALGSRDLDAAAAAGVCWRTVTAVAPLLYLTFIQPFVYYKCLYKLCTYFDDAGHWNVCTFSTNWLSAALLFGGIAATFTIPPTAAIAIPSRAAPMLYDRRADAQPTYDSV